MALDGTDGDELPWLDAGQAGESDGRAGRRRAADALGNRGRASGVRAGRLRRLPLDDRGARWRAVVRDRGSTRGRGVRLDTRIVSSRGDASGAWAGVRAPTYSGSVRGAPARHRA